VRYAATFQNSKSLKQIMVSAGSYDFMSPSKVDRKRRRYFDKISKLYPVAVQKGLFGSNHPCYKAVFQPNAPEMRERHRQWLRKQHSAQHRLHAIQAEEYVLNKRFATLL
jgi:hypothetical protein